MNYCNHFSNCKIAKKDYWKIHRYFMFTENYWVCLNKKCIQSKEYFKDQKIIKKHSLQMVDKHEIFINILTKQIICSFCNIEIYDFDQLTNIQIQKYQDQLNPYFIRQLFEFRSKEQNLVFGQLQNPQSHEKNQRGLTGLKKKISNSYINCAIHLFSSIRIIKSICKNVNISIIKKSNKCLIQIIQLINTIWSGKLRVTNSELIQKLFIKQNEQLKGYKKKHPFQIVRIILALFHEQFKFYEQTQKKQIFKPPINQWDIQYSNQYQQYSPITIIFLGKIKYYAFCKKCNKEIQPQENFMGLKIPYRAKEKQNKPKKNRISTEPQKMISLIQLLDQLYQCKTSLLKKCQTCEMTCVPKMSKFKQLPNILLLNIDEEFIKRGENIDFPDILNLQKYTEELKNTNYKFVSCIAINQIGRYYVHTKHYKNLQTYKFQDQIVKLNNKKPEKICVLVYQRISQKSNQTLFHNVKSNIKLQIKPEIFLPEFWYFYLKCLYNPRCILNPLVCTHNKIKPFIKSKQKNEKKIPRQIYQVLLQKFGGRNFVNQICVYCKDQVQILNKKKIIQKELAKTCDRYPIYSQYLISKQWIQTWKKFLYSNCDTNYFIKGNNHPRAIRNIQLILDGKVNPLKKLDVDYKIISCFVWYFLYQIYGGGPEIKIKSKNKQNIRDDIQMKESIFKKEIIKKLEQMRNLESINQ